MALLAKLRIPPYALRAEARTFSWVSRQLEPSHDAARICAPACCFWCSSHCGPACCFWCSSHCAPRMMLLVQFATVRNLLYPQRTLIYASCRIVGNPARIECGHELYPRTRSLVLTI